MMAGRLEIRPQCEEIQREMEYEVEWIYHGEVCTTCWKIGGRYKFFKNLYFLVK
jgi:hypothetical protein